MFNVPHLRFPIRTLPKFHVPSCSPRSPMCFYENIFDFWSHAEHLFMTRPAARIAVIALNRMQRHFAQCREKSPLLCDSTACVRSAANLIEGDLRSRNCCSICKNIIRIWFAQSPRKWVFITCK